MIAAQADQSFEALEPSSQLPNTLHQAFEALFQARNTSVQAFDTSFKALKTSFISLEPLSPAVEATMATADPARSEQPGSGALGAFRASPPIIPIDELDTAKASDHTSPAKNFVPQAKRKILPKQKRQQPAAEVQNPPVHAAADTIRKLLEFRMRQPSWHRLGLVFNSPTSLSLTASSLRLAKMMRRKGLEPSDSVRN